MKTHKEYRQAEGLAYVRSLLKEHNISISAWAKTSCGWANWKDRSVKIPNPFNVDRFCVCLHEVKHILDGDKGKRFEQEFDCDMYALTEAARLGYDTAPWVKRMRWHSLSRVAMATNRGLPTAKIPARIREYFSDVDFSEWDTRKVFVSAVGRGFEDVKICITYNKRAA